MMKLKKILSVILSVLLFTAIISIGTFTANAETYSGTCGMNAIWQYDNNTGTLTISGLGLMRNYSYGYYDTDKNITTAPWKAYYKNIKTVIIDEDITSIGSCAFWGCSGLDSVVIGDSVTSIGNEAFRDCSKLKSVIIGNSVVSIGDGAFDSCSEITSIVMPGSVTSIGDSAFSNCTGIKTAGPIGGGYDYEFGWDETIPNLAFKGFTSLSSVTLPDSVTSIGDAAFYFCTGLTSITIPDSVTLIGGYAFYYCISLSRVNIGSSVTLIGGYAFEGCYNLELMILPVSVTRIGDRAFYGCGNLQYVFYEGSPEQKDNINIDNYYQHNNCFFNAMWRYNYVLHKFGDINNDNKVNNKDLTRLFQYLSNWDVEVNEPALDVNGDEMVNNRDLTRLFQYLSDWDVEIY